MAHRVSQNDPLGLKIYVYQDIKSKVGIQAAEWILSHMLEISHARGPRGAPEGPQGQLEALGAFGALGALGLVKMTPLSQKNIVFNIEC